MIFSQVWFEIKICIRICVNHFIVLIWFYFSFLLLLFICVFIYSWNEMVLLIPFDFNEFALDYYVLVWKQFQISRYQKTGFINREETRILFFSVQAIQMWWELTLFFFFTYKHMHVVCDSDICSSNKRTLLPARKTSK